jgi:hypothetical protein
MILVGSDFSITMIKLISCFNCLEMKELLMVVVLICESEWGRMMNLEFANNCIFCVRRSTYDR